MNNNPTTHADNGDLSKTPKYLLTDDTFNRLRQSQEAIQKATGFTPSFKKLINDILTATAIDELTQRYIEKMSM